MPGLLAHLVSSDAQPGIVGLSLRDVTTLVRWGGKGAEMQLLWDWVLRLMDICGAPPPVLHMLERLSTGAPSVAPIAGADGGAQDRQQPRRRKL